MAKLKSITMSFSAPVELSIQMEEHMENTGLNRSELIKIALIEYFRSKEEKNKTTKKIDDTYETVLELKQILGTLSK